MAVSGGVDSVVLLDIFAKRMQKNKYNLIVAHFDHGIRKDSKANCEFVAKLSRQYKLKFVSKRQVLGAAASEEQARKARYAFLGSVLKENNDKAILTAQHADDLVETMLFNAVRGTYSLGLTPFISSKLVKRPFINLSKDEILNYARQSGLSWVEDPTNKDQKYARNYIRNQLLPRLEELQPGVTKKLLSISKKIASSNSKEKTLNTKKIDRAQFLQLSSKNALEYLYSQLSAAGAIELSAAKLKQIEQFVKTSQIGKQYQVDSKLRLGSRRDRVIIYRQST